LVVWARRRAGDRFTLNAMIGRLIGVYDELMCSSPGNDAEQRLCAPIAEQPPRTAAGPQTG
jgi:hypothetical protein